MTWEQIAERLIKLGDEVEELAAQAAGLVGDVQSEIDPTRSPLDPRKCQVKAAQFAAGLQYEANQLRSKGGYIEREKDAL